MNVRAFKFPYIDHNLILICLYPLFVYNIAWCVHWRYISKELTRERKRLNGIFREKRYFCSGPSCAAFLCFVMACSFIHVFLGFVMTPSCLFSCVMWWHISIQSMLSLNLCHKLTSGIISMLHHGPLFFLVFWYVWSEKWKISRRNTKLVVRSYIWIQSSLLPWYKVQVS